MTRVITQPQLMASAAADIAEINSAIGAAKSAAADPTTTLVAAAADEVLSGARCGTVRGDTASDIRPWPKQGAVLHENSLQALAGAGRAYAAAEAANAAAICGALGQLKSPIQSLLGGSGVASPAITPMVPAPASPFSPGLADRLSVGSRHRPALTAVPTT